MSTAKAQFVFYEEDFNSGTGGWVSTQVITTTELWSYSSTSFPGNTTGHWKTNPFDDYTNNLRINLESPSIDLTSRSGMTFSLSVRYNTESRFDGAQVEYSVDGGNNWTDLGTNRTGTNWYNDGDVDAIENRADGWSGDNGLWETASVDLPAAVEGESDVRFRLVFASDYSVVDDGVAIDDILISDGTTVYAENFDVSDGGWESKIEEISSEWVLGSSGFTGNATDHWYTNPFNDYDNSVDMALLSPSYDFSAYNNLTFNFDLRYKTEAGWDGFNMEYSIDSINWFPLGAVGEGVNWYNETDVDAIADGADGWSGDNLVWQNVSIDLPSAVNEQPEVFFRFRFVSDGTVTDDGVGFDNVNFSVDAFITQSSGSFNDVSTWLGGVIPGTSDVAFIDSNDVIDIASFQAVDKVVMLPGSVLNVLDKELEVRDSLAVNGTAALNITTGTVRYTKSGDQDIARADYYDLALEGSGIKRADSAVVVTNELSLDNSSVTLNANNQLTIASSSSGDARILEVPSGASITGEMTVERYFDAAARKWWHMSSPVQNATAANWQESFPITGDFTGSDDLGGSNNVSAYGYNETVISASSEDGWEAFPSVINTEIMEVGKGYRTFIRSNGSTTLGPVTVETTGLANVGTVNLPVTYTTSGPEDSAAAGWNFVGNPYASEIDWENPGWTKTNLTDAIYIWDAVNSRYVVWSNGVGVNGGTGRIATGQGFWVKAHDESPALVVSESVKSTSSSVFYRNESESVDNVMKVSITDGQNTSDMSFRFDDGATELFDIEKDAYYFGGNSPINICSFDDQWDFYAINSLPDYQDVSAKIWVIHPNDIRANFTLSFNGLETFVDNPGLKLVDLYLEEVVDIYDGMEYEFKYDGKDASRGSQRFVIQREYSAVLGANDRNLSQDELSIYPNPISQDQSALVVIPNGIISGELTIVNLRGEIIHTDNLAGLDQDMISLPHLDSGMYMINFESAAGTLNQKLIVE